jgi:hypothetical protein
LDAIDHAAQPRPYQRGAVPPYRTQVAIMVIFSIKVAFSPFAWPCIFS